MTAVPVRVALGRGCLRVEIPARSELLSSVHRIFFINVLGFEQGEGFSGYSIKWGPADTYLINEVLRYLEEQGVAVTLDTGAAEIVHKLQSDAAQLETARSIGRRLKHRPVKLIEVPGLKRRLKSYQVPAIAHLIEVQNAANFSVPGSGKTSIALAAYAILKQQNEIHKLVIIGPRSSFMPWEEEYYACFHRKPASLRIIGPKSRRKKLYREADSREMILLTYQMTSNDSDDVANLLRRHKIMLVVDESHNIKRLEGGKWSDAILSLAPYAAKRVILSGTPAPNSLQDLWSQITFLWPNPQLLGSREQFKYRTDKEGETLIPVIRRELYPFYWRIHKSDINLPKPRFHRIELNMKPYQLAIYKALAAKVLSEIVKAPEEREKLRLWRRTRMVRLLQAASNPSLLAKHSVEFRIPPLDASGLPIEQLIEGYSDYEVPVKIDYTVKLARELVKKKQKVLIWTAFIHNIKTLERSLSDLTPRVIYGDIPKDESENDAFNREKMINEFKTSPKHHILIANPGACAESISLHKVCCHSIYLDRTFNGAQYMQSLDRIHRVGLAPRDRVHYYIVQSKDTIDQVIDERLDDKQRRMLQLLDDDFGVLDLDSSSEEFSEEREEDADFSALINDLKQKANLYRYDR